MTLCPSSWKKGLVLFDLGKDFAMAMICSYNIFVISGRQLPMLVFFFIEEV